MTSLVDIEGIGDSYADKLHAAGVKSVEVLLEQGATPAGRARLAEASGVDHKLILKWVNHADLFRVNGVAGQFAELLEAAGVDTVAELGNRNATNLAAKLEEVDAERHLVHRVPAEPEVARWIAEAKTLPRKVSY